MSIKNGIPFDGYVQLGLDQIDHGDFKYEIDEAIGRAVSNLLIWQKAMDVKHGGSATVTVKIKIKSKEAAFMKIEGSISSNTPSVTRSSLGLVKSGRLLSNVEGADNHNPRQMTMFDMQGNPKGTVDLSTGELIDPQDDPDHGVAGSIAPGA